VIFLTYSGQKKFKKNLDLSPLYDKIKLLNRKKEAPMELCMNCNENSVDTLELYCTHCSLNMLAESMQYADEINSLFLTAEAK
jgi:hypothetical protein